MCSGQLTPPCPKPICGLATLASLSERGGGSISTRTIGIPNSFYFELERGKLKGWTPNCQQT